MVEVSVLHGLKQGNEVLKQIHKEMNLESVEKLLEETAEARAYQEVRPLTILFFAHRLKACNRKSTTCSPIT